MDDSETNPSLEKITRVVLIIGIITVSGGILYTLTRPAETDVLFFLLNEDQVLRDYPTNTTLGIPISFYTYVQNVLGEEREFCVKIFQADSGVLINSTIGIHSNPAVSFIANQTKALQNQEEWISEQFQVSFTEMGENQQIFAELWVKSLVGWEYIPDYVLILRIDVYAA